MNKFDIIYIAFGIFLIVGGIIEFIQYVQTPFGALGFIMIGLGLILFKMQNNVRSLSEREEKT